jgi:phospholipid/cholesterol/gamma-HCH transport system substrate-binding protein
MAQRKLTWTELRVGLFVLVALVVLALGVFYVTGAQGFWVPKIRLNTYMAKVDQLQDGAVVTLDGLPIGIVESFRLNPSPSDKAHNMLVVMRVNKKYQDQIRTDSTASLATEGLFGNRYVEITRGVTGTVIPANGTVPGSIVPEMSDVVQRGYDVVQNLGVLQTQISDIVASVNKGEGTLGKFLKDPSLYNHANDSVAKIDAMIGSIQQGQGSIGKVISSDELYNKIDTTVSNVNDVLAAVKDQKGMAGQLIYDPAMAANVRGITEKGNKLFSDIEAGKGSIGKLVTNDEAYNELLAAATNVRDATGKLNSNEGTLGKMFSDPALYDNMTGLTGDLRLLIGDFRKEPKKYLQVKLGIF